VGQLVIYVLVSWYIFPHCGTLYEEKSGNPAMVHEKKSNATMSSANRSGMLTTTLFESRRIDHSLRRGGEGHSTYLTKHFNKKLALFAYLPALRSRA
jgi:hypothetical protein